MGSRRRRDHDAPGRCAHRRVERTVAVAVLRRGPSRGSGAHRVRCDRDARPSGVRRRSVTQMQVGAFVPVGTLNANPEFVGELGPALETRGFDSVWVAEHVVLFDDYASQYPYAENGRFPGGGDSGLLEPLTALAYIAATTTTLRLGTGICLVGQRNPVYTAKQVADVDVLSNGRVDFGIGIGWLREEFDVVAMPFNHRGARSDEHIAVMKELWTNEVSS